MIQIESIHIQELRGIRDLKLSMNRENFVVSGPNGSGKSGVVDAIQFALTGEIGRLKGSGTGDLTLSDHGPHVEKRSDPDAASVRLNVFIPHLKKSATIVRTIKKAKHPQITPNEDAVKAAFAEVAEHPEITLSRPLTVEWLPHRPIGELDMMVFQQQLRRIGGMSCSVGSTNLGAVHAHTSASSVI